MKQIECADCCIIFLVTDKKDKEIRNAGDAFFCPNGHKLHFSTSENDKLKERIATLENYRLIWITAGRHLKA